MGHNKIATVTEAVMSPLPEGCMAPLAPAQEPKREKSAQAAATYGGGINVSADKQRPLTRARVHPVILAAVDAHADRAGFTRSESIRALLVAGLESCGLLPAAGGPDGPQ